VRSGGSGLPRMPHRHRELGDLVERRIVPASSSGQAAPVAVVFMSARESNPAPC